MRILNAPPTIPAAAIGDLCRHVGLPPEDVFAIQIAPTHADFHLYVIDPHGNRTLGPDGQPTHHTVRIPVTH